MRIWGDRVPSPATGLDAFASDARLQFYGGAFIEVARSVFRTVQDIDQVCLTEALREAAGVGPTTNLVQDMLVSSRGEELLADGRRALRALPPDAEPPSTDDTGGVIALRPPDSSRPTAGVSFDSEVVLPAGNQSCVCANTIKTKSSLRSSGTRPDDTTEDTTDYTPTGAATTPPDNPPSLQSEVVLPAGNLSCVCANTTKTKSSLRSSGTRPDDTADDTPVTAIRSGGGTDPPPTPDPHTPAPSAAARRDPPMSPTATGSDPPPPAKSHRAAPRRLWGDYSDGDGDRDDDDDDNDTGPHAHTAREFNRRGGRRGRARRLAAALSCNVHAADARA